MLIYIDVQKVGEMHKQTSAQALGVDNIGKLLFEYSLPAIIAMTASAMYNIIDRIFIGNGVGPLAISGLALTLPVINMGIALGALVGAGSAALSSIRLGERRPEEAVKILGNTLVLNLILSISYSVIMLIFLKEILIFFGASADTLPYAYDFMFVILIGNVFNHLFLGFNNIMRAVGFPVRAMKTMLLSVGLNIVFAPIFIFALKLGIKGAALATVIASTTGFIYTMIHFTNKENEVCFTKGCFKLDIQIIKDIFAIGMSPFFINLLSSVMAIVVNRRLVQYGGDYAVGAFGIIFAIIMFTVLIVIGVTQGMQPIAGYNYGAKQYDRVREVFNKTVMVATCITTFCFLMAQIFPKYIAMVFTDNDEMINLTAYGMRLLMLIFPLIGFQIVASNFFQSVGKAKISVILALSRQVIFLIPGLIILPHFFGLFGVWVALPIGDFLSVSLAFFLYKTQMNKILPNQT